MQVDVELYRTEVQVQDKPPVTLSVIDIAPPHAQRTLLFIHGFAGQASQWAAQLGYFSPTQRVVAFDARGHGLSDKPESSYTMAELQRDLKSLVDQLNLPPRFVLVGHSFGGAVAAEYAAAHPHRLEALVLIGTAGEYKLNDWLRRALNLPTAWLKGLAPVMRTRVSTPPFVVKKLFENTLAVWKGWSLFADIRTPTLVIMGHHDNLFPQADFDQVAARIPYALKIEIPVSAHMVMIERADAVNRAIERFLNGSQDSPATWSYDRPPLARPVERPWLRFYDPAVPHEVTIPDRPLPRFLERAARRFPLRTAVHDPTGGTHLLYWQLDRAANRVANALIRLGVQQGDRVLLMLPAGPPAVIAFYGILKAGALVVMLNPAETPARLQRQVTLSGARVLVTSDRQRALSSELVQNHQVEWVLETAGDEYFAPLARARYRLSGNHREKPPPGFLSWSQWVRKASPQRPPLALDAQDGALVQFTSGTTGEPRAVLLTHGNLVASTIQVRHWFPGLQDGQEKFLSPLPIYHVYGILAGIHLPVALGATLLALPAFDITQILTTIKRQRPTVFAGTPATYLALTEVHGLRTYGVNAVKLYVSGAAPLPVEVHEAFERLSKAQLLEGYGLSEAPAVSVDTVGGLRKTASVGLPLPNTDVRLVDLTTQHDVDPGLMGELWVAGPQVMAGYWQDPTATAAALVQDTAGKTWLRTGDLAVMDSDGYLRILGRVQDVWQTPGTGQPLVLPRHIEEVLHEHPGIKDAAAVPVAGAWHAFVVPHRGEGTSAGEIIAYCRLRLPPAMVPQAIIFRESLPKDELGKVQRQALTDP